MYVRNTIVMDEMNAHEELSETIQRPQTSLALNPEWLASLSHELRSPLTAIQGYASMLLRHNERISSEEREEFLLAISQSSSRLADVLDRFLDVANLEAGMIQPYPLPIDMGQLVQEALLTRQQACPNNNVSLTIQQQCDPALPLRQHPFVINADSSLIHKMLIQLLDNAQKYSAAHAPIEVTLSCPSLAQRRMHVPPRICAQLPVHDQQLVELSVQDHGIGIPLADQERIFERFERVNMQLTREVSGLGLGLTMCKYIVALHDGVIWVESTPGEGSTFHVLFPAVIPEQGQTPPQQSPTPYT
jgi:signal transduction histidine kinase